MCNISKKIDIAIIVDIVIVSIFDIALADFNIYQKAIIYDNY